MRWPAMLLEGSKSQQHTYFIASCGRALCVVYMRADWAIVDRWCNMQSLYPDPYCYELHDAVDLTVGLPNPSLFLHISGQTNQI